jgi:hypothetical protein
VLQRKEFNTGGERKIGGGVKTGVFQEKSAKFHY